VQQRRSLHLRGPSDRVAACEGATELIHIGQAVLNLKGTSDYFIENTFNCPTLAEAYKIAGLDAWNRFARA
jgi:NAD(P) transhydrogenase